MPGLTLIFTLLSFLTFSTAAEKIILRDRALFGIDEQIYFLSSTNLFIGKLKELRCLGDQSLFLQAAGLTKSSYPVIMPVPFLAADLKQRQLFLDKVILVQKYLYYTASQAVDITYQNLKGIGFDKCYKGPIKGRTLKSLLRGEFFLRQRFLEHPFQPFDWTKTLSSKISIFSRGIAKRYSVKRFY